MASFYIRKHPKSSNWSLMEQSYDATKSIQKTVHLDAYRNLGFDPSWTIDQAKERCRLLNKHDKIKRKEQHKIARIATIVEDLKTVQSIFIPPEIVDDFYKLLTSRTFGNANHQKRIHSHFKTVCNIINELKIEPQNYFDRKEDFYAYFLKNEYSLDYSIKLLRIINMFGKYLCKKRNLPHDSIPAPENHIRNRIDETYQDSEGFIGESDPLSPQELIETESLFKNSNNFKWLWISIWFGLRPIEVDNLINPQTWKIEHNSAHKVDVLHVYQSKLTALTKAKRWKKIPILFKEQTKALEYLKEQTFKRPTRNTLKIIYPKAFITTYAGRKGFVNLMLSLDQTIEAISSWMGHQDISITWKKYRDKEELIVSKK